MNRKSIKTKSSKLNPFGCDCWSIDLENNVLCTNVNKSIYIMYEWWNFCPKCGKKKIKGKIMNKKDQEYIKAAMDMESAIEFFIDIAKQNNLDTEEILSRIQDAIQNGSNDKIIVSIKQERKK